MESGGSSLDSPRVAFPWPQGRSSTVAYPRGQGAQVHNKTETSKSENLSS